MMAEDYDMDSDDLNEHSREEFDKRFDKCALAARAVRENVTSAIKNLVDKVADHKKEIAALQKQSTADRKTVSRLSSVENAQKQRLNDLDEKCNKIQAGLEAIKAMSPGISDIQELLTSFKNIGHTVDTVEKEFKAHKDQYHKDRNEDAASIARLQTDIINTSESLETANQTMEDHQDRLNKLEERMTEIGNAVFDEVKQREQVATLSPSEHQYLRDLMEDKQHPKKPIQQFEPQSPDMEMSEQVEPIPKDDSSIASNASIIEDAPSASSPEPANSSEKEEYASFLWQKKNGVTVPRRDRSSKEQKDVAKRLARSLDVYKGKYKDKVSKKKMAKSHVMFIWNFIKSVGDPSLVLQVQTFLHEEFPKLVTLNPTSKGPDDAPKIVTLSSGLTWPSVESGLNKISVCRL